MSPSLQFSGFEVRPAERQLLVGGEPAAIGARAFDLLVALIERRERIVAKAELLEIVWPRLVVAENNLQVHVWALRKLLGPQTIATIPGRGYRFTAPLSQADETARAPQPPVTPADAADANQSPSGPTKIGNLPEFLPPLFGREADLKSLLALLDANRLLTICGAGGIGKTRLAHAVAHELRERFAHGVWMIELAWLNDPALVVPTVAQALGISLPGLKAPLDEAIGALQAQSLLLVLDNCEHLLQPVSELALRLVREAPGVRVLATSQELLRVAGEHVFRLAPLAVPPGRGFEHAAEYGAVRLFVERAKALDPRFELSEQNADAVIDICAHLDGIALAIELAAARVPMLGVHGIHERIGERLRMLTGGARVSLRRHQTLRAAFDWSHGLLSPQEQKVFRRLGVFSGGFVIESAQQVAGDEGLEGWAVLDHLGALIDKSLVLAEGELRPRYRMLESARAYAMEKLAEAGETEAWLRRHAEATKALCEQAAKQRDIERLNQEMNNVRAAFAWAAGPEGDDLIAVALATTPSVVLAVAGFAAEALQRLLSVEPMVTAAVPRPLAAQYWQWLGRLGIDGRLPISRCVLALQRAEDMWRALRNGRHLHGCLRMRAEALLRSGDVAAAQTALAQAEAMEDQGWPVADRMRRLRAQGLLHDMAGRAREALQTSQQAFEMAEAAGIERYVLVLLSDMANVLLKTGQAEAAAAQFQALAEKARLRPAEGLTLCYALAGLSAALTRQGRLDEAHEVALNALPLLRRSGIFLARADTFAWLMARRGEMRAAAQLVGAADAFHDRSESARDQLELSLRQEALALLEAEHDAAQVERWRAQGALMSEDALARSMGHSAAAGAQRNSSSMSASKSSTTALHQ